MADGQQNNVFDYVTYRDLMHREDLIVQKIDRVAERHSSELSRALADHELRSQKALETTLKNFGHEVVKMFEKGQHEDQTRIRDLEKQVSALQAQIEALKDQKKEDANKPPPPPDPGAFAMMKSAALGQNGWAAMFMGVTFLGLIFTIIMVIPDARHFVFPFLNK